MDNGQKITIALLLALGLGGGMYVLIDDNGNPIPFNSTVNGSRLFITSGDMTIEFLNVKQIPNITTANFVFDENNSVLGVRDDTINFDIHDYFSTWSYIVNDTFLNFTYDNESYLINESDKPKLCEQYNLTGDACYFEPVEVPRIVNTSHIAKITFSDCSSRGTYELLKNPSNTLLDGFVHTGMNSVCDADGNIDYYVDSFSFYTYVVSVPSLLNPLVYSTFSNSTSLTSPSRMKVMGELVYISATNYLVVLNVSNYSAIKQVGVFTNTTSLNQAGYVEVLGNYTFIGNGASGRGIVVLNTTNLSNIKQTATLINASYLNFINVIIGKNDLIYATSQSKVFVIINISNPSSPLIVNITNSSDFTVTSHLYGLNFFNDNYLFITDVGTYKIHIYNITDSINPIRLGTINLTSSDYVYNSFYADNLTNLIYTTTYPNGVNRNVEVFNISNLASPTSVINVTIQPWFNPIESSFFNNTFFATGTQFLTIVNFTNPSNPNLLIRKSFDYSVTDVYAINDFVFVLNSSDFIVFDVGGSITPLYVSISSPYPNGASVVQGANISYWYQNLSSVVDSCWWSRDDGVTNTTITCGNNITGQTWNNRRNNVTVWINDTTGLTVRSDRYFYYNETGVSACGTYNNGLYYMTNNIVSVSGDCIRLTNAIFNMEGYSVSYNANGANGATLVGNSTIKNGVIRDDSGVNTGCYANIIGSGNNLVIDNITAIHNVCTETILNRGVVGLNAGSNVTISNSNFSKGVSTANARVVTIYNSAGVSNINITNSHFYNIAAGYSLEIGDYNDPQYYFTNVNINNITLYEPSNFDGGLWIQRTRGGIINNSKSISAQGATKIITVSNSTGLIIQNFNASGKSLPMYLDGADSNNLTINNVYDDYGQVLYYENVNGLNINSENPNNTTQYIFVNSQNINFTNYNSFRNYQFMNSSNILFNNVSININKSTTGSSFGYSAPINLAHINNFIFNNSEIKYSVATGGQPLCMFCKLNTNPFNSSNWVFQNTKTNITSVNNVYFIDVSSANSYNNNISFINVTSLTNYMNFYKGSVNSANILVDSVNWTNTQNSLMFAGLTNNLVIKNSWFNTTGTSNGVFTGMSVNVTNCTFFTDKATGGLIVTGQINGRYYLSDSNIRTTGTIITITSNASLTINNTFINRTNAGGSFGLFRLQGVAIPSIIVVNNSNIYYNVSSLPILDSTAGMNNLNITFQNTNINSVFPNVTKSGAFSNVTLNFVNVTKNNTNWVDFTINPTTNFNLNIFWYAIANTTQSGANATFFNGSGIIDSKLTDANGFYTFVGKQYTQTNSTNIVYDDLYGMNATFGGNSANVSNINLTSTQWIQLILGGAPTSTCIWSGTGNFNVNCTENCNVTASYNLLGNNISIVGEGTIICNATLSNYTKLTIAGINSTNICTYRKI